MIQTPMVFLPGTICDERLFMPLWRQMDIQDRRYIPLQWAETPEQMQGLVEHAVAGDKVHLVGFSMGGYIASQFALANPDIVQSLTLIGYNSKGLSEEEIKRRKALIHAIEKGQFRPMSRDLMAAYVHPNHLGDGDIAGTVQAMEADLGGSVLLYHTKATTPRPDLTPALAKAGLNINIIAADNDQISPLSQLQQMAEQLPGSQLHIIENSGHMLPLEQPGKLAALLTNLCG